MPRRLTSGRREELSSKVLKEQKVVERKRNEEVMRRRQERLDKLREEVKTRWLQQKQHRQQLQEQMKALVFPAMLRPALRSYFNAACKPRPGKQHKKKNYFLTAGLPLVLFIVGGYVTLTQFVGGKFEAKDHLIKSQSVHTFNLEEEHTKMTKKLALDDFELKPIPKPKDL
ncbi:hypothetical protein CCR75_005422 [Bremia lactucae]|uniref:Uncharacterized protein n=1 Tax=Bremia lactucae TaxID=4779 RepID=A0A976IE23_BRELC|nr:hypothetical protein CCR75_005422 [Bremia lactucae]